MISKVGRNDPCPCGSGKKYKHCCLRRDRTAQRDTIRLRHARDTLPEQLWQFAIQPRFAADVKAGFGLFWNNRYQPEDMAYMQPEVRWRFIDWYVHDFRTSEDRKTPAELFARERSADLQPEEREVLEARIDSVLSVYEVVEEADDETGDVQLEDVLLGDTGPMPQPPTAHLHEGDFLWSRLISIRGVYSPVAVSMLLPPEFVGDIEALIDHHFERYEAAYYQATKRQFLKDSGYLFNHYFMDALQEKVPTESRVSDEEMAHDVVRQLEGQIIIGTMDQHYERWFGEPILAWDNKSPRELMKTEQGRQRVYLLLDEMKKIEEQKRIMGQPHYDVERLRMRLGLVKEEAVSTPGPMIYTP